jgi:chromosome segregation ATPase
MREWLESAIAALKKLDANMENLEKVEKELSQATARLDQVNAALTKCLSEEFLNQTNHL